MKQAYIFSSILYFLFLAFQVSCTNKSASPEYAAPVKVAHKLTASNIYRADSVKAFINAYAQENKSLADEYINKSAALKGKDDNKAIYFLKKSITLYPDQNTYKQLGTLLTEKEKYEDAVAIYSTLINIDPNQSADTYAAMIKASMIADMSKERYDFVLKANSIKIDLKTLTEQIISDPLIKEKISNDDLNGFASYTRGFWDEGYSDMPDDNQTSGTFADYITQFKSINLPLVIGEKQLQNFDYSSGINYDYDPSMDFTKFDPERINEEKYYSQKNYLYLVTENATYIALIYAGDTSATATGKLMRCIYHRLATYDNNGKYIDSKIIGTHTGEDLQTYTINKDLTITSVIQQREWKKPFLKYDIDNEIVATKTVNTVIYKIDASGTIDENSLQ